jgi:glutaredoxin
MSSVNINRKSVRRKSPKRKTKSVRRKSPKRKTKSVRRKSPKRNKRPFNKKKWYIVTKEGCKHCDNAKKTLKDKNIEVEIEVINDDNKLVIYEELDNITGKYRFFPMIFYNGKFIGGYTDLQKHKF